MTPKVFELRIPDAVFVDLKTRLGLTRFPDAAPGEPWAYGSSVDYVRDLVSYWKDIFDWRTQEAALNVFPQLGTAAGNRFALSAGSRRRPKAVSASTTARLA